MHYASIQGRGYRAGLDDEGNAESNLSGPWDSASPIGVIFGLCWGYIGRMDNKMEATIHGLGFRNFELRVYGLGFRCSGVREGQLLVLGFEF